MDAIEYLKKSTFTTDILCSKKTSLSFAKHLEKYANEKVREREKEIEQQISKEGLDWLAESICITNKI